MKKNNFYYFKRAFLTSFPIAIFVIVQNIFEIGLSDTYQTMETLIKGILVGVLTGTILGMINIFAKVETFIKKESSFKN